MKSLQQQINNSYESEPSSSNGSSIDAATPQSLNLENPKLADILNVNIGNENIHISLKDDAVFDDTANFPSSIIKRTKKFEGILHSSEESEFEGFSDSDKNKQQRKIPSNKLKNLVQSSSESDFEGFASDDTKSTKTPSQNTPNFSSEEISDQDVRCQNEMKQLNLDFIVSKHLLEISQFSIEPNSSGDGSHLNKSNIKETDMSVFNGEHSCNAVDNKISNEIVSNNTEFDNELSFNGKIDSMSKSICAEAAETVVNNIKLQLLESKTNYMQKNEQSPDLFEEFDDDADDREPKLVIDEDLTDILNHPNDHENVDKIEKNLLSRIQTSLLGVLPPPSVTILQYDILDILSMYKENFQKYIDSPTVSDKTKTECLLHQSHTIDEVQQLKWPQILQAHAHGVSYNRSTYSENIELLCMKYAERNIGAETSSSFTYNSPTSSKKRNIRMKMLSKSPGSRLSHLARRRAVFSSANLLSNTQSSSSSKLGNKQLVIDTRKIDRRNKSKRRTPKRRTSTLKRTPGRKTPGSERKRNQINAQLLKPIASTRETSKRALFQSPPKEKPKPQFTPEIASRVEKSKRVLFSPQKNKIVSFAQSSETNNNHETIFNRFGLMKCLNKNSTEGNENSIQVRNIDNEYGNLKRKRDEDSFEENSKFHYLESSKINALTPHSNKLLKSQSFSVGESMHNNSSVADCGDTSILRANSETALKSSQQLSNLHRQKLFWAVSTSLKKKQINSTHVNFKQYASVLAKVVKRLFLETMDQKSSSTSTTMLRIADKHVFWAMQGKTVDEIYISEKIRSENVKTMPQKLTGYIAPEEYEQRKHLIQRTNSNLFLSDNSMDSFNISQTSFASFRTTQNSQSCEYLHQELSQNSCFSNQSQNSKSILSVYDRLSVSNSSSKSNNINNVLRENFDSEQRQKSAQKNLGFSGKNQKNVSPYNERIRTSISKQNPLLVGTKNANILKAKRQISFDA